jgi:hypothetical protein
LVFQIHDEREEIPDARAIEGQCRIGLELVASTPGTLGSPAHPIKAGSLYRYALVAYGM